MCCLVAFAKSSTNSSEFIYSTLHKIAYPKNSTAILHFFNYTSPTQQGRRYFFFAGAAVLAPGLGRLAPYLERLWVRPFTPAVSKVPRTM